MTQTLTKCNYIDETPAGDRLKALCPVDDEYFIDLVGDCDCIEFYDEASNTYTLPAEVYSDLLYIYETECIAYTLPAYTLPA